MYWINVACSRAIYPESEVVVVSGADGHTIVGSEWLVGCFSGRVGEKGLLAYIGAEIYFMDSCN